MASNGLALAPLLRVLQQRLLNGIHDALETAGYDDIGPSHGAVLPFVTEDGIRVSDLARRASVRKQSMAQSVAQLEALGYLKRTPDPSDRRAQIVTLTAKGRKIRPVAREAGLRVQDEWAKLTSPEEMEVLTELLQGLLDALQTADADLAPSRD